jgi:hypothetical protein
VQTDAVSDAKVTGNPEEAVALIAIGPVPKDRLLSDPNVIACPASAMLMLKACVAAGATPFAAVSVPVNAPAALGVPLMTPVVAFNVSPVGNAPLVTENVGAGAPVAVTV